MTVPAVASVAELAGPVLTAVGRWHRPARCTAGVAGIAAEDGHTPLAGHQSEIETKSKVTTYIHVCAIECLHMYSHRTNLCPRVSPGGLGWVSGNSSHSPASGDWGPSTHPHGYPWRRASSRVQEELDIAVTCSPEKRTRKPYSP